MYLPRKEEVEAIARQNKTLIIACILLLIVAVAGSWMVCRHYDNQAVRENRNVGRTVQSITDDNQHSRLQTIINEQETTLAQLQSKLDKLSSNSTTLQTQLAAANEQLLKTKNSLQTANGSLTQANSDLQRQNESLQTLTSQINEMTKKQSRLKRQRDTWAIAAGILAVGLVAK